MRPIALVLLAVAACGPPAAPAVSTVRPPVGAMSGGGGSGSRGGGSKSFECKEKTGCTVTVSGQPTAVAYGSYAPVACGPGIVVLGCGCGYVAPASCGCGPVTTPLPSCSPAPPPSCGGGPACGSAGSCGGGCGGSGCGGGCGGCA